MLPGQSSICQRLMVMVVIVGLIVQYTAAKSEKTALFIIRSDRDNERRLPDIEPLLHLVLLPAGDLHLASVGQEDELIVIAYSRNMPGVDKM
jgi:hypothetical protein